MKKLILLVVDTDKDNTYLEDAVSIELTLKLRPWLSGETAEMLKLTGESMVVLDEDMLGGLGLGQ